MHIEEEKRGSNEIYSKKSTGFHCGSAGKESTCNAGDLGLIPGLGRSPGESTQSIILAWNIRRWAVAMEFHRL